MFFICLFSLLNDIADGYFYISPLNSFEKRPTNTLEKMFAVMPYDTEDRSAAYRRRVAPRADFVCKYCQRRFTKVSLKFLSASFIIRSIELLYRAED